MFRRESSCLSQKCFPHHAIMLLYIVCKKKKNVMEVADLQDNRFKVQTLLFGSCEKI